MMTVNHGQDLILFQKCRRRKHKSFENLAAQQRLECIGYKFKEKLANNFENVSQAQTHEIVECGAALKAKLETLI